MIKLETSKDKIAEDVIVSFYEEHDSGSIHIYYDGIFVGYIEKNGTFKTIQPTYKDGNYLVKKGIKFDKDTGTI